MMSLVQTECSPEQLEFEKLWWLAGGGGVRPAIVNTRSDLQSPESVHALVGWPAEHI